MRNTLYYRIFAIVFGGAICTPLLFASIGISFGTLEGKTTTRHDEPLTLRSYLDGRFQRNAEQRFEMHSGIRTGLIRVDNQINFSIFNQLSTRYDSQLILGAHNSILERSYLADANRTRTLHYETLRTRAERLRMLHGKLSARGASLLVLISPNKLAFNPEILLPEYRIPGAELRPNGYGHFVQLLQSTRVPFFDSPSFLQSLPEAERALVFTKGGTHWSEYAACRVASALARQLSAIRGTPLVDLECLISGERKVPAAMDQDILRLANLLFPWHVLRDTRYPKLTLHTRIPEDAHRPRIFVEGTSFCWPILRRFEKATISSSLDFLYYSHSLFTFPKKARRSSASSSEEWRQFFDAADIVIIEINQSAVEEAGHSFIEAALR